MTPCESDQDENGHIQRTPVVREGSKVRLVLIGLREPALHGSLSGGMNEERITGRPPGAQPEPSQQMKRAPLLLHNLITVFRQMTESALKPHYPLNRENK